MKIKLATVAKRGVNLVLVPVNAATGVLPFVGTFLKFLARGPKWLVGTYKGIRSVGLYQFTDRKGRKFNLLMQDGVMEATNGSVSHQSRMYVLDELRKTTKADGFEFEVPALYLWHHPVRGLKFARLRDATTSERKEYIGSPVRDFVAGYVDYVMNY